MKLRDSLSRSMAAVALLALHGCSGESAKSEGVVVSALGEGGAGGAAGATGQGYIAGTAGVEASASAGVGNATAGAHAGEGPGGAMAGGTTGQAGEGPGGTGGTIAGGTTGQAGAGPGAAGAAGTTDCTGTADDLVFTEVMYQAVTWRFWFEWVEVVNTGNSCVLLDGWVFDNANGATIGNASNVPTVAIEAGEAAVLYPAANTNFATFSQWDLDNDVTLVPVTGWVNNALDDSGDTISLWTSYDEYDGDNESHAHAAVSLTYVAGGDWPTAQGGVSITLVGLDQNENDGANWVHSVDGVDGARTDTSGNIGSPGTPPPATGEHAGTGGAGGTSGSAAGAPSTSGGASPEAGASSAGGSSSEGGSSSTTGGASSEGGSSSTTGGSSSSAAGDSSSTTTGGSSSEPGGAAGQTGASSHRSNSRDDHGCGCRAASGAGSPLRSLFALGLLGLGLVRRRRRQVPGRGEGPTQSGVPRQ